MQKKIILGLGNPGAGYLATRHNYGFRVVDALAQEFDASWHPTAFDGWSARIRMGSREVHLAKPTTYMNRCGQFLKPFIEHLQVPLDDCLVAFDDLDLPMGRMKLARKGSSGGHNGLKSIFYQFETERFHRLKLGIGHPEGLEGVIEWVLAPFSERDEVIAQRVVSHAIKAVQDWVQDGMDTAMNRNNGTFVRYSQESQGGN